LKGGVADALLFFLLQFPLLLRFWILDSTLLDSAFCVRCTLYLDSHWTTPDHIRLIFMFESTHPPRLSLDPDLDLGIRNSILTWTRFPHCWPDLDVDIQPTNWSYNQMIERPLVYYGLGMVIGWTWDDRQSCRRRRRTPSLIAADRGCDVHSGDDGRIMLCLCRWIALVHPV